jgi:hypothetical protein
VETLNRFFVGLKLADIHCGLISILENGVGRMILMNPENKTLSDFEGSAKIGKWGFFRMKVCYNK